MRINKDDLESKPAQNPSVFKFGQNDIRVYQKDNDPWFVASDVAKCLGIKDPKDALKNLRPCERSGLNPERGGTLSLISESGLYTIILRSKSAIREGTPAYNFRVWVTDELLPAVRKNGMYIKPGMILHSKFPHINFEPMPEGSVCFTPDEVNLIRTAVYYHSYLFKDCHKATCDFLQKMHSPLAAKYWEMLHTTTFWQLEDILNKRGYPMKEFSCYRSFKGLPPLTTKNNYLK